MSEQLRSAPRNARDPAGRPSVMASQLFVFTLGPKDQILVQCAHRGIKRRAIISPVILEPASDNRIEHPRQIFNRLVAAVGRFQRRKVSRVAFAALFCGTEIDEDFSGSAISEVYKVAFASSGESTITCRGSREKCHSVSSRKNRIENAVAL